MELTPARILSESGRMFLRNYTSTVPVAVTISRIESILIQCGVRGITKEYGPQGETVALTFHIDQGESKIAVRLPANRDDALNAFWADYCERHPKDWKRRKSRKDFAQQAERTAWKLMQDWVGVQMSLVQLHQAEVIEIFLPYVWDGKQTFFQSLKSSGYRALLAEKN